jgi:hypothetical protein
MAVLVSPELSRSPPQGRLRRGSGAPKSKVPVNARQQDLGASGGEAIGARALRGLNSFPSVLAGPSVHYACRDFDRRRSGRRCSPFTHTGSQRQETWGDFDCQQDFGAAHLVGSRAYSSLPTDRVTASMIRS